MQTMPSTQETQASDKKSKINRYVLGDGDFAHFEKAYGISKNNLASLIFQLEEFDRLVSARKMNTLIWKRIGRGVSHITQAAEIVGVNYQMLMKIVPELENFNESLKERPFSMFMRKYRRIFGFTAREIAEKTKTSLSFIRTIECGISFPMPKKAEKILRALGLTGKAKEMYQQAYRKERGNRSLTSRFEPSKKNGVGSMLRQIRISAGWSQPELDKAGIIDGPYLCEIERGYVLPSVKIVRKLLRFYAVATEEATALLEILEAEKAVHLKSKKCGQSLPENAEERMRICKDRAGKMLRSFRERAGFSQKFLADRLGLNDSLICRWESDNRPINSSYLNSIAKILNLSKQEEKELLEKIQEKVPRVTQ